MEEYKEHKVSREEGWIIRYLEELQQVGIVNSFDFQPTSFVLFDGLPKRFYRDEQLKTKVSRKYSKRQYLINPHVYTPDFKVEWVDDSFLNVTELSEFTLEMPFVGNWENENYYSYLEVKPSFDRQNMTRMFTSHIQPVIWEKYGIYIQLIKPLDLFKKTFMPEAIKEEFYYKVGKKKGQKKFKWKYKTLNEYLNNII